MFNPKSYFEELISAQLKNFVHSLDKSQLSLGIWNGDVQLSNFTLKNQLIPIGNGVGIGLEYGSVGSLRIQVPWTRLQSGEIQVTTEDIDLVLRVHIDHEQLLKNPLLSKRHIKKMASVEEKDRRLFETSSAPNPVPDTEPSKSWIETAINSFLGSYLAKLVRGCTICAERINITVVIPLTHQSVSSSGKTPHNEYAVFRYSVASIEISTLSKEQDSFGSVGSDSSILRKLINRRRKILEPYESSGTANGASPSTSETDYEYDDSDNDSTNGHNGKKVPQLHNQAVGGIGGLAEEEITFEKNLNIRGMKLSLAKIHGIVFETQMDYEKLIPKSVVFHSKPRSKSAIRANSITYHTILNPTHIFTRVSMYNVRSFDETIFKRERSKVIPTMADATISSVVLDVSVDVNNIEITPSINELRTLRDVSNMTSMLKMRSKFGMLRPSACVQGHARQWWLYAISSIIVVARESRRISASDASDKDIDGTPADEDESGNDIGFSRVVAENKIVLDAFRWSYIKVYKRSIVLKFRELLNSVKMAFPGNSSIPFSKSIKRFSPESSIVLAACKPSIEFLPDDLKLECMDYERILNEHQLATSRAAIRKIFIESAEVSVDLMKLLMCNVVPTEVTIQMLLDNVSNLVDASLDSMEENAEEQPDSDDDYNFPDFSNHPNYQFTPVSIVPDSVPASASIDRESSVFKQVAQPTDPVDIEVINFLKSFDNLQSSMDRGGATRSANKLPSAVSESVHSSASSHIQKAMPHTSKSSLYTLCEVSLDRLSVSIAEKSSVTGKYNITGLHTSAHSSITPSDKLAEDHQFNTLLHVVIYGIYTQLETIGQDEYEVVLRVGCMKIYGNNFYSSSQFAGDENIVSSPATVGSGGSEQMQGANHIELFSCGRPLTDSYDGSNSLKDAAIGDLALSLSIQSCHTVADGDILEVRRRQSIHTVKKVRSAKTHDSKSRTARNQTTNRHVSIRRQHFVVELSLDVCYAYWDQPTMLFLRNIILSLMLSAKSSTNVISTKTVLEAKKMISHVLRYRNAELNQVRYSSKKDASAAFSDSADSLDMYDDPTPKFSLDIILKGFIINIPSESSVPHADDFAKMYAKPRQMASATHGALASEEGKSALTEVSQSSVDSDYSDDSETNLIDSDDDDDEYNHMPFTPLTSGPDRQTLRYDTPSFATKNTHFFPEPPVDARRPKLSKQNLAKLEENQEKPQAELHILPPCLFPRRRKKVHSTLNLPVLQFKVSLINFSSGDFLEGYVANVKHLQHIENCKREEAESKAKEREEDAFTSPVKDRGVSKSQKHKEEANSSKEDDNVTMWPRADNILCHAIEKIKSPVIRSIAFGLKNVELKFVKRIAAHDAVLTLTSDESFELIRNLTKIPWCVKGVISQSELPYHPLYTDWKLHILFSPLAAALSTQDMISMIDASHCIEDVIKIPKNIEAMIYKKKLYNIDEHQYTEEEANNRVQSTALPRFSELSGLSKLYVNAHFDDICLSLMEEKDDAPESSCNLVESIVKRYVDQMLSRGLNQTRVIKACKRLSSQRLCNIGIPRAQAEVIMDTLHNSIAHSLNRPDDDDSVEEEAMVYASKAISQVLQLLVMPSPTVLDTDESPIRSSDAAKINELLLDRRTPISSLEMKGLGLTVEQLMYDHRALVFMKELRLSDQNRNPILLVAAKNRAPVHPTARTNQTPVMDRSSRLGSLNSRNTPRSHKAATTTSAGAEVRHLDDIWRSFSEHNAMCSAIVVTVQDRDNDFEYGTGGYDSESVFSTGSPLKSNNPGGSCYIYPSHLANRKRDTDVKVSHVDSYLSRDGIPRIIEQVLPAIGRVQHHYDVVGFAYKRHQQLLVNNVFIPQLGYRNIFDTNSMYYIDIAAIAVQSQKLKRMFDSPTVVKSSPEEERSRNNRPVAPVKTANVAQRRFSMDIARRMSAPDVRNSVVIPKRKQRNGVSCFSCSVQIVVVLLAHEDKIMAELILNSVNVENRPGLEPPPTNSETCPVKPSIGDDAVLNSEDHTVVTVDHLRMYDLTAAGSMHSQFIWSLPKPGVHVADTNTSTAATTESIFEGDGGKHPHCLVVHLSNKEYSLGYFKKTVNISTNVDESQTDSQTPGPMQTENIHAGNSPVLHGNSLVNVTREIVDLNINTYGVNACFLFRFYQELMLFVFGKIITPIDAALKANASGREDIANKILDCTVLGLDDFDAFVDESRVYGAQNMATHDPMEADVDDESLHSSDDSLYDDFGDIDYLSSSSESDMEESLDGKSPNMGLYNSPVGLTTSNSPSMFETPLVDGSRNESNDFFTPFGKPVNSMGRSGSKYALNSAVSARRSGLRRRSSYRYSAHENLSPVISLESRAENVRDSQLFINIHLHDFAGILPRNSCSEDLVGLTAQYAYVSFYPVEESWKGIFERREVNISDHDSTVHDTIHFDVRKNDWAAGCTDATTTKIPCFNMPDIRNTDGEFADSPVGEPSVDVFDNKPPVVKPTLSKLFSLVSSTENEISKETLVSEATQDSVSVAHDAENVYDVRHSDADPWVMGRRTTMTSSDFASTLHASTVQSQPPDYSGYAEYVPIKAKGDEPYMRHYIRLESVSILGCLHSPIDCSLGLVQQQSIDESRKFSRIRPNHAIYTGLNSHGDKRSRHSHRAKARASVHHEENPSISAAHSYTSRMQWHPITSESFDLKIIIDVNPRNVLQVRTLISDTENFTPICLKATMGELYLLKSIYFDNICELPQFFDSPHDNPPNIGGGPTDETDAIPESIPEYGTPEYLMYLKDRPLFKHSGFAMVCAKLTLDTSIDINYFSENVPSLPYLLRNATPGSELLEWLMSAFHAADSSERQSLWNYQSVPIATIGVERWVLHVQNDLEVTQVGLGADGVYIVDIRTPAQTCQPTLVQASAVETADDNENGVRTENYGFVDFDYGLFLQPSSLKEYIKPTQVGTPLQLTVHVSAKSNWTTTNVGVDNADINIINLDMIWLLADIFSLYFVSPDYGNPSVAAYKALPSDLLPYGGSDTRVFATRPHIIVMASPLNATSQSLHLETDCGIYYRNSIDFHGSVNVEVNFSDLALVLLRHYKPAYIARGMRGAAGSGRGVRTQIDHLSGSVVHHYDAIMNHFDLQVNIEPIDIFDRHQDQTEKTLVDFDDERLKLHPSTLFQPKCVFPLSGIDRDFPENSCDVVTSYEDMLLTVSLITTLIDMKKPEIPPLSDGDSHAGGDPSALAGAVAEVPPEGIFHLASMFTVIRIQSLKCLIVDNVLGLHLPLLQLFVDYLQYDSDKRLVTSSVFDAQQSKRSGDYSHRRSTSDGNDSNPTSYSENDRRASKVVLKHRRMSSLSRTPSERKLLDDLLNENSEDSSKKTPQFTSVTHIRGRLWADYFSNVLKCWECLFEPVMPVALLEESPERGTGYTVRFSSAFHINLTGALLRAVNDILRMIQGAKENIGERLVHGGERAADDVVSEGDRALISIDAVQPEAEKVWQPLWPLGQSHGSSSSGFNRSFRNGLRRRMSGDFDADLSASVYQTRLQIDARSNTTLHHQPSFVLSDDIRVGFSILNLSGQSIRYIQGGDEGKYSIFYLADSERGALNFLASTTLIRNNQIFEEEFTVQQPKLAISDTQSSKATRTVRIGHQVAVQVSGYKWLPCVQADTLGVRYEELHPVIGRKSLSAFFQVSKNSNNAVKHILNATRLVTEVRPFNGGRLLTLKSVFCFQNNTTHAISILGTAARRQQSSQGNSLGMTGSNSPVDSDEQQVFRLESGSLFHVPISLLHNSALADARTPSLGSIYIKPYDLNPVKEELVGKHYMQPGSVSYTVEPIDLLDVVMESQRTNAEDDDDNSGAENSNSILASQYCCNVRPRPRGRRQDSVKSGAAGADAAENNVGMTGRLPPFCYTTEIRRIGSGDVSAYDDTNTGVEGSNKFEIKAFASNIAEKFFSSNNRGPAMLNHPASYMIIIHPPIILENLLACGGKFTLVHAIHKTSLWSGWIGAGMVQSVHTVTLDEPLLLLINLKYCRSTEGVLIHKPANMTNLPNTGKVIAEALKSTFEGFLDDEGSGDASVFLTDTVGQRLRLNIQNSLGGGGQRHIMIYCPYWIINTSQFSVRIREDGDVGLPAGTVTSQRNGTRPVADADIERSGHHFQTIRDPVTGVEHEIGERTLFPGQIGPLHNLVNSEIQEHSELNRLLHPLPFEELVDKSYLFNYKDDSRVLGSKRTVSVQLDDSEWSVPFSLDTAGVNQSAVIESACGTMEIGIRTELAPGKLAKLTKIVRFSPKFVATNDLPTTIELVQASGVGVGDTSSVQISPGYRKPFHLPALFGERIVSLKVHGPWKTSVPFEIDHVGTYTINIPRRLDLSSLHHVQTRGAAEYSVLFPSVEEEAEIGIWFETDWAVKECVVKSIKSGLFAATQTEIQLGDVVLAIDGEDVHSLPFDTIMQKMKSQRMRPVGTTVTFRTVEEKLRIIRMDAVSSNRHGNQHNKQLSKGAAELAAGEDGEGGLSSLSVRVDLRNVESSLFLHLSLADPEVRADYRIENNSCSHVIHYKQKNVPGIRWAELMPGKSANYVWDDPFQPHRLLIRSGRNIFDPERGAMFTMVKMWNSLDKNTRDKHSLSTRIGNSDPYVMGMHFDEMNKTENLPLPNSDAVLPMVVTSDGPTKVLRVSPPAESARRESIYSVSLLTEEVYILEVYEKKIENLLRVFDTTAAYDKHDALDVENTTEAVEDDLGVTPQLPKMLKRKSIVRRSAETTRLMIAGQMAEMLKDIREAIAKHKLIDDNSSSKVGSKFGAPLPLCAYSPVDSPLGPIIENEHGLMVEVLEARDLRSSSSLQGDRVEDVFCKVYVKSPDDGLTRVSRKYMLTYLSDRTMDPLWFGQKFIFDVPEKASLVNRGFFIRIIVKYTTVFGTKFMGQADVPLSGLLSEEAVCGWFPLRGKDSTSISTRRTTDVSLGNFGSIRLRLQWVFTDAGLVKHTLTELRLRKHELEDHLAVRRAYLRAENDKDMMNRRRIAKNGVSTRFKENSHGKQSTRDIVSPLPLPRTLDTPVRRSVTKKKSMEKFDEVNIRTSSSTPRRSSTLGIKTKFVGAMKNRKSMFSINTNLSAGDYDMKVNVPPRTKRASVIVPMRQTMHDQLIMQWAKCLKRISEQKIAENGNYIILDDDNKPIQSVLRRKDSVHNDNLLFLKRADEECNRSYHHVHSTTGTLEITAIQALQLPDPKHPLHVSINYGDEIQTTHSMPAASDLTFVHVESLSEDVDVSIADRGASGDSLEDNAESVEAPPRSEAFTKLTKLFKMDLLNVKGSIRVKIVAERFPKNVDVAVLDIPVFNLLDNICTQDRSGGSCYDRWFALVLSSEFVPSEGNKADFAKNLQSERTHYAPFGYAPCIRLQFRWKSEAVYNHDVSKFYTRVQLPDFSVSVIDSIHAREIMQLSISGMTVRQFETNAVNDTSVNISMLQVDNQLQLPLAPVIFYPTQFKFPQPVIRYHMRKSIVNSQPHLKSYETIQLIVQEFDLKLEQQTIVTTWELVQDWLTEVRQSIRMLGNSNEYEGAGDGTETVNDGAHTEHSDRQKNSVTKWFGMPFVPNSEEQSSKTAAPADIDENRVIDKIYVEVFTLMPIKINVSFIMTPQLDAAAGAITGTALANQKMQKDTVSDSSGFGNAVWQFLFQVGEVVLDLTSTVDNAPIMLNGLIVPNLFETEEKLFGILQGHYLNSALRQLYKIAGSLELVGNPIGLMSSLGTGVRDFFFEPGLALISNPTEFRKIGKGVVKGTLSLVSNTADGMISTGTTFTRAAGRGLATLSMDHAFMIARQELQRTPQDIGGWLIRPIRDIRNGVYYGIVGIVRVPYVSIRRYGSSGVIPGVAKGIAGLPAKAVVGILDAATHVGESFTEGMKYLQRETTDPVTRRRLSNLFGPDGRILPFSNTCALGTYLLRVLDQIVREKFSNNVSSAINEGVLFVRSALGPSKGSKNDAKRRGSLTNGWLSSKSGDGADDSSGYKHREGRGSFGHRGSKMFDFYSSDAAVPDAPDPLNTLEMNKEFVIFTAILRKGVNIDQVIVVSSNRVVVVDYRRERGGSFVKLVWQSLLINIRTPLLERNGGGATLKVRTYEEKSTGIVSNKNMQRSNSVHETVSTNLLDRRKSISPQSINSSSATNDYLIVATYQDENTLIQLCNCLNLMIGNFDNIIPSGAIIGDELGGRSDVTTSVSVSKRVVDLEEDDSGVVRIGPWEYSRDNSSLEVRSNTITTAFSNPEVGAILEAAEWIVPTSESDRQSASNWLFKEGLASEAAHLHIRELKLLCEDEELLKSSTSQNFVQLLKDGNVTYDEFKTFYEMEMRNAAELRASQEQQQENCLASAIDLTIDVDDDSSVQTSNNINNYISNTFSNLSASVGQAIKPIAGLMSKNKKKKAEKTRGRANSMDLILPDVRGRTSSIQSFGSSHVTPGRISEEGDDMSESTPVNQVTEKTTLAQFWGLGSKPSNSGTEEEKSELSATSGKTRYRSYSQSYSDEVMKDSLKLPHKNMNGEPTSVDDVNSTPSAAESKASESKSFGLFKSLFKSKGAGDVSDDSSLKTLDRRDTPSISGGANKAVMGASGTGIEPPSGLISETLPDIVNTRASIGVPIKPPLPQIHSPLSFPRGEEASLGTSSGKKSEEIKEIAGSNVESNHGTSVPPAYRKNATSASKPGPDEALQALLGRLGKLENILNNALLPSTNASIAHSGRDTPAGTRDESCTPVPTGKGTENS